MGSKWRKAKTALGLNLCIYAAPRTTSDELSQPSEHRHSDVVSTTALLSPPSESSVSRPTTPTPSSSGLRLPKHGSRSSTKTICAICLTTMKPGHGHAIFTAECSHSFHFHCITSNVKHGNRMCPVCRAKWKEIPFQNPISGVSHRKSVTNSTGGSHNDAWTTIFRHVPSPRVDALFHAPEPSVFNDDDILDPHHEMDQSVYPSDPSDSNFNGMPEVKMFPEVSAVPKSASHDNFAVLIHLKAPQTNTTKVDGSNQSNLSSVSQKSRAPVDLVTVLDVSGSMAGTKLALLKQAMGFVIQNLGHFDRLSVIAFSSSARRIFPLRRMTESGRQHALQAVNSLIANGGTNIAEGLKKGAKVLVERQWKNPVASIILLSDGQDTYTVNPGGAGVNRGYESLIPVSISRSNVSGLRIPVHAFGFGADHDAVSMHSISDISGGTFSFIEAEGVIQDAFAQCIGGLLSVVVQDLKIEVECGHPKLQLLSIEAGNYQTSILSSQQIGFIEVGDLYAEEERDFLVTLNIPVDGSSHSMLLLKVKSLYCNPITKDMITLDNGYEVHIQRPELMSEQVVSLEVDRQRNRLRAAKAMTEARHAAEQGDLTSAVSVLENCRKKISETFSACDGDQLCVGLCAELKEMQERMANRQVYETSGRAYVLSGISSHAWQRATARGDSTSSTTLMQSYQTPSMVDMVSRSQTMIMGAHPPQRRLRQALSFPARPQPR